MFRFSRCCPFPPFFAVLRNLMSTFCSVFHFHLSSAYSPRVFCSALTRALAYLTTCDENDALQREFIYRDAFYRHKSFRRTAGCGEDDGVSVRVMRGRGSCPDSAGGLCASVRHVRGRIVGCGFVFRRPSEDRGMHLADEHAARWEQRRARLVTQQKWLCREVTATEKCGEVVGWMLC